MCSIPIVALSADTVGHWCIGVGPLGAEWQVETECVCVFACVCVCLVS